MWETNEPEHDSQENKIYSINTVTGSLMMHVYSLHLLQNCVTKQCVKYLSNCFNVENLVLWFCIRWENFEKAQFDYSVYHQI